MSAGTRQKVLLALMGIASLGTTALIAMNVLAHRHVRGRPEGLPGFARFGESSTGELPTLGDVPAFVLTDHDMNPVNGEMLRGKVWIVDFIFTRCSGPCLRMNRQMHRLQKMLSDDRPSNDVRFLSVSVDPDYDTPQVLRQYAARHGADTETWSFATGPRQDLRSLVVGGFKLPIEQAGSAEHAILHSDRFVLVDRQGRIRGYYHGISHEAPDGTILPPETDRLLTDVKKLLATDDASQS